MLFKAIKTPKDVDKLKRKIVKDDKLFKRILKIRKESKFRGDLILGHQSKKTPTNAEVLALYKELVKTGKEKKSITVEQLLRKTKTKSNSGIVSVSLLTKSFSCPGKCIYCPTEKQMPKSYLSLEPAAARALRNNFDPYKQVTTRLKALELNGHPIDKIEIIVIGGTWSVYDKKYQDYFISEIFRACNNFKSRKEVKKGEKNLNELQKINEKAKNRVIGLSVETRPDCITLEEIEKMREWGVTKVEIGVQHLDDKILEANKRGVTEDGVAKATKLLRTAGIKIVYHMMPNLYKSTPAKDLKMFKKLFTDPRFFPDMLKIYPCVVLKGTGLYKLWKEKKFKPYSDKQLKDLLIKIKKDIPPYTRIIRLIRDIPASYIVAGSKISNLRQIISEGEKGIICRCIRCREIREDPVDPKKFNVPDDIKSVDPYYYFITSGDALSKAIKLEKLGILLMRS